MALYILTGVPKIIESLYKTLFYLTNIFAYSMINKKEATYEKNPLSNFITDISYFKSSV